MSLNDQLKENQVQWQLLIHYFLRINLIFMENLSRKIIIGNVYA